MHVKTLHLIDQVTLPAIPLLLHVLCLQRLVLNKGLRLKPRCRIHSVGGLIGSANLRMFTPLARYSYLLDAIAAVFIGASIHPRGRPNVPGTLVGVVFLVIVANGLNLMGLNFNTKDALSGIILVGALALAVFQKRMR